MHAAATVASDRVPSAQDDDDVIAGDIAGETVKLLTTAACADAEDDALQTLVAAPRPADGGRGHWRDVDVNKAGETVGLLPTTTKTTARSAADGDRDHWLRRIVTPLLLVVLIIAVFVARTPAPPSATTGVTAFTLRSVVDTAAAGLRPPACPVCDCSTHAAAVTPNVTATQGRRRANVTPTPKPMLTPPSTSTATPKPVLTTTPTVVPTTKKATSMTARFVPGRVRPPPPTTCAVVDNDVYDETAIAWAHEATCAYNSTEACDKHLSAAQRAQARRTVVTHTLSDRSGSSSMSILTVFAFARLFGWQPLSQAQWFDANHGGVFGLGDRLQADAECHSKAKDCVVWQQRPGAPAYEVLTIEGHFWAGVHSFSNIEALGGK
jgi:hypothetical protein